MGQELKGEYVFPFWNKRTVQLKARKYRANPLLAELQVKVTCAHICTEPDFDFHANTCLDPLHQCPQVPLALEYHPKA